MIISTHRIYEPGEFDDSLLEFHTIPNPVYYNNERRGYSNRGVPEKLKLYRIMDGKLYLPRNAPYMEGELERIQGNIIDKRVPGKKVKFNSKIQPYDYQLPAIEALTEVNDGILVAGCGTGKTIMFLEAMSRVGVTTLVLVHKEFLMDQWADNAKNFLGLTDEEIGICRSFPSTWTWKGKKLVIGMLQSLYQYLDDFPPGFREYFGLVGADECHRMSAPTFERVIEQFPSLRRWGLTATLNRADGLERIFISHLGPVVYEIEGTRVKPVVVRVPTNIRVDLNQAKSYGKVNLSKLVTLLAQHPERNKRILQLLGKAAEAGRRIIVLTDRREHAEFLKESFDYNFKGYETRMYVGGMSKEERQEAEENADIFFATFQMAKEGLDIPSLDTLFLVTPNSSEITVEQSAGRISREHPGKKQPMIVDFVDNNVDICMKLYFIRMRIYQRLGIEIQK